jgi:hypothetical protein
MIVVTLTTDLPASSHMGRVRRRRKLGAGTTIRLRPMLHSQLNDHGADVGGDPELSTPTLLLDGKPIAYINHYNPTEWQTVDGGWWGNGLAFDIKETT